jgi:hypothetical protein
MKKIHKGYCEMALKVGMKGEASTLSLVHGGVKPPVV